jgi:hypothetical protein
MNLITSTTNMRELIKRNKKIYFENNDKLHFPFLIIKSPMNEKHVYN